MLRQVPIFLAVALVAAVTIYDGIVTNRWTGGNQAAELRAELLKQVPKSFDDWVGTDSEVDEDTQVTAGAVGYVSRTYVNKKTKASVNLWLIVGHAHAVVRHPPNVCYPSGGFKFQQDIQQYPFEVAGEPSAVFKTTVFQHKENSLNQQRVFWAWHDPKPGESVTWMAPDDVRYRVGSSNGLFKMYFTASEDDSQATPESSVCNEFAQEFLPIVNDILAKATDENLAAEVAKGSSEATSEASPAA